MVRVDETPVQMLATGEKKTHRAYVWGYATTPFTEFSAVVYDFSLGRSGEYALTFCVARLPGRRHGAYWQQSHRKSDKAMGARAQKLAVLRLSTQQSTCGGADELDPVGQA